MDRIPFYMITGFLGSGKTTFLKRLINQYSDSYKLAVVQNEFAPVNTDAIELRDLNKPFQLMEVNNGSVFCVCLLSDFTRSLSAFLEEHKPDVVFLETTGLADPIAITELLQSPELAKYIETCYSWCIVDAYNFLKTNHLINRIHQQIRVADKVMINKEDLVDRQSLSQIEKTVVEINPFTKVQRAQHCKIDLQGLSLTSPFGSEAGAEPKKNNGFAPEGRPDIGLGVLKSGRKISLEALKHLLNEFTSENRTMRIKGFVATPDGMCFAVQTSFDQIAISEVSNYNGITQLVAFGQGFSISEFSKKYRILAE